MRKSADHAEIRQKLIDAAIAVVYANGMEGCTSKRIAEESGLNEAYIFRYFFDMKDLREKAFFYAEEFLFDIMTTLRDEFPNGDKNAVIQSLFPHVWNFFSMNPDKILYLVRFYFSTENTEEVKKIHFKNCRDYFRLANENAETEERAARMGSASLMTLFQYAATVHGGMLEDTEETRNRILKYLLW